MNENYLPEIENYLAKKIVPERENYFLVLEKYAKEQDIPIIHPEVAKFLEQLVSIKKPQNILEIGTASGYSALWLVRSFAGEGFVYTVEFSSPNIEVAAKNFKKYDKKRKIKLIANNAFDYLKNDNKTYDFIFIDAQKKAYSNFLAQSLPRLSAGGIIVFDNLFWHGQVPGIKQKLPRFQKGVKELRAFNKEFMMHPWLDSVILPVGDGLGIGVKRG